MVVEKATRRAPARQAESVQPLLTTLWGQGAPYNSQCPTSNGQRCVTGCAATSLSMIFYYWKYPTEPTPVVPAYTSATLHLQLGQLEPIVFDWANMQDQYYGSSDQTNAVGWLMRYVGQAERMDYTPGSSGTYGQNIMDAVRLFGFGEDATYVYKENYTDEEWAAMLQDELAARRPLEFCAYGGMSGHAFNVDGYDADNDKYHINWGWNGSANGYFALNAFKGGGTVYRSGQQMVIGLEPPATVPTIKVRSSRVNINALADKSAIKTFTVKGRLLTDNIKLQLNDPSGKFRLSTTQVSKSEASNGKTIVVTYSPTYSGTDYATVTLSSAGAQDVTVSIQGTAKLETYDPVLQGFSNVSSTSFQVKWQDNTPVKNVSSYSLERTISPFNESRLKQTFENINATSAADCSSHLDEILSSYGWTGNKVYLGEGYLRLATQNNIGWLCTPAVDMSDNNGLVTVKVRAKSANSSSEALLRIACGNNDTTIIASTEEAEYCVMLPCESTSAAIKLSTRVTGQRILIYGVEVIAGDDYSPLDSSTAVYLDGISKKSHQVTGITPGSYAMRVQAHYVDGTVSSWSNSLCVIVDSEVGDVNRDGEINIADVNTIIDVIQNGSRSARLLRSSDVNGDGEVNIADINALIGQILSNS